MDVLDAMRVLRAAVDAGSLSAAARRLRMPLPTVSRKVADLEQQLGARLLERSSRGLALTEAGRGYHASCEAILLQVDEAARAARGELAAPKGRLVVTAPRLFGRLHVLPVVLDFLRRYPDVDVQLALSDRVVHLFEEQVDVAVRIGQLEDSSAVATRLSSLYSVVCASPAYLAEHGKPRRPEDLGRHSCVCFEAVSAPERWGFDAGKRKLSVAVHSRLVVSTAEAAIDAALAGLGVTRVLSYQVERELAAGTLLRLLQRYEPSPLPVSLVYSGAPLLPAKVRAFVDHAAPALKRRLGGKA